MCSHPKTCSASAQTGGPSERSHGEMVTFQGLQQSGKCQLFKTTKNASFDFSRPIKRFVLICCGTIQNKGICSQSKAMKPKLFNFTATLPLSLRSRDCQSYVDFGPHLYSTLPRKYSIRTYTPGTSHSTHHAGLCKDSAEDENRTKVTDRFQGRSCNWHVTRPDCLLLVRTGEPHKRALYASSSTRSQLREHLITANYKINLTQETHVVAQTKIRIALVPVRLNGNEHGTDHVPNQRGNEPQPLPTASNCRQHSTSLPRL